MDSATRARGAQSLIAAEPERLLTGHIDRDWSVVQSILRAEQGGPGALIGWVSYEGDFCFGLYRQVLRRNVKGWQGDDSLLALPSAEAVPALPELRFQHEMQRATFLAMVERAQDYIAAGDIYQVNLAHRWSAAWPHDADPFAYYQALRRSSPAPYAAYLNLGGQVVMSSSPECYLRMEGRRIVTRPIKGTRARHRGDAAADRAAIAALKASPKERAELIMITDLERNDLGQVCEYGSVRVPALAAVESFAQVHHLVSTVEGQLRADVDHAAAFRACFPGGSITGAPKKRAREIITELEPSPRGLYTGAMGYFGFDGTSQFNIAIRTAVQRDDTIHFHTGAGIVADSVPAAEWQETLDKAAGLLLAAKAVATSAPR